MVDKKRKLKFKKKKRNRYRFAIINANTLDEKISVRLSRLNVFAFLGVSVFLLLLVSIFLISTTPLSEFVPGRAKSEVQKDLILLTSKSDSLMKNLELHKLYLQNIKAIINDGSLISPLPTVVEKDSQPKTSFTTSSEESQLRNSVEEEDLGMIKINNKTNQEFLLFFSPINGVVVDKFNVDEKHFGLDLVAKEKTSICSVLEGVVVVSTWTSETGYIIAVQHKNGYLSLYKHNSVLLKSVGDFVTAGEHIAIIGNSGEISTGPHLHFELWHDGIPINPENYILF